MSRAKSNSNAAKIEFVCQFAVLKELQSIPAFYAYEQVKVNGSSMRLAELHDAVFDKYHGKGGDSIGLVEKFIRGEEMFAGIYDEFHDNVTGRSMLVLKPELHCQIGKDLLVDSDPRLKGINMITMSCSKLTDSKPLSGRTIWEMGKRVEEHGRKILAIVLKSKFKDGSLPSGVEWEDYLKFCRYKMMQTYAPKKASMNDVPSTITLGDPVVDGLNSEVVSVDDEEAMIKDWDSSWCFPGFMAWALWGHIPMPGMDECHRAQCLMTGDDSVSIVSRKSKSRATSRKEIEFDRSSTSNSVRPNDKSGAAKVKVDVKEQYLYAEHQNAKRFRLSMLDLGQQERQSGFLNKELDQANLVVLECRSVINSKPDVFENPDKYRDWLPYREWKEALAVRDTIMKEIRRLREQSGEIRRTIALEAERARLSDTIEFIPPPMQAPVQDVIILNDDSFTLTTNADI